VRLEQHLRATQLVKPAARRFHVKDGVDLILAHTDLAPDQGQVDVVDPLGDALEVHGVSPFRWCRNA
jgi:hypothetical protein